MCGIVGYVGSEPSQRPLEVVLDGLARLEYRGYDSAGIALNSPDRAAPTVIKRTGKLAVLRDALQQDPPAPATSAIGHTRWATHGEPSEANAHPQVSADGTLALVHNGIIENAAALAAELRADGYRFQSQTDTEVVAHLLHRAMQDPALVLWEGPLPGAADEDTATDETHGKAGESIQNNEAAAGSGGTGGHAAEKAEAASATGRRLVSAMLAVTRRLVGGYTLLATVAGAPRLVVAARRSSPLVVGVGEGANYLGSDALAFADYTTEALEIDQDQVVAVTPEAVTVLDRDGSVVQPRKLNVDFLRDRASKDGWPTFMEKEIHEQPRAIFDTLAGRLDSDGRLTLDEVRIEEDVLRRADKMVIVACGTAAYAGQVARYAIEHWCRIPVEVELAHEFRYRDPVVSEKTLVVAVSQSGETMDTIMAIRHARNQGARVIAVVNTPGSTIARESDAVLLTHAGPEIAVASTKAFTSQIVATYILGLYLAQIRGNKFTDEVLGYMEELDQVPDKMQQTLDWGESVRQVAASMADVDSVIYLGRHVGFPVAMEGALKLKEIAYIHAEGFAAGELKHGPIALVEEGTPVLIVVPTPRRPELHAKVVSNIEQVKARGATTLVVAEEGDSTVDQFADVVFRVPPAPTLLLPLLQVLPLQEFACALATAKGLDVDQPRNLAKSVTVE